MLTLVSTDEYEEVWGNIGQRASFSNLTSMNHYLSAYTIMLQHWLEFAING